MPDSVPYEVRLRVQGVLDPAWSARLADLVLDADAEGTTLMQGRVIDQAALHGLLDAVRDLGLALVSVEASAIRGATRSTGAR